MEIVLFNQASETIFRAEYEDDEFAAYADYKNRAILAAVKAGVDLSGADLSGAHLWSADLRGVRLSGANLEAAELGAANLAGANLGGANLCRAQLYSANLGGVNLDGANLTGANLDAAELAGTNLNHADLDGIYGNSAYFRTFFTGRCAVTYTDTIMQIERERFTIAQWWAFDDDAIEALEWVDLTFWRTWKPILQHCISTAPARPTGYAG